MTRSFAVPALVLCTALCAPRLAAGAEKPSQEEASALIVATAANLMLGAQEPEPFRIRGVVRFLFDEKAPQGQLAVSWAGPLRHRIEWALPGWRELRLQDGAAAHVWRGPENDRRLALMSALLQQALFPVRLVTITLDEKGRPLFEARRVQVDGRELVEVRMDGTAKGPRLWIDETGPQLVAFEDRLRRFDFAGRKRAGGRLWPLSVRVRHQGRELLGLSLSEPVLGAEHVPDALFAVPSGAQARASELTAGLRPPRLVHAPEVHYPVQDRKAEIEGTVVAEILVGTDGAVRDVELLAGLSRSLNASALKGLSERRYEPARMDGKPVEFLSTVWFRFELEGSSGVRVFRKRSSGAR